MVEIGNILEVENYIDDLEAVVFDLDDTLYPEKEYVKSGYRKIAEYFGIPEMESELWAAFETRDKAIDEVLEKHGMMEYKNRALHVYRFHKPNISLYPGVREMLGRIKERHKTGIITDGRPEGQRAKLKVLGLNVDKVIITDELGGVEFRKPNPKAFEEISRGLGVNYKKMCYVGDNIRKDFLVSEQLGMRFIWFRNSDGIYYQER